MFDKKIDTKLKRMHNNRVKKIEAFQLFYGSWTHSTKIAFDEVLAVLENIETDRECKKTIAQLPF